MTALTIELALPCCSVVYRHTHRLHCALPTREACGLHSVCGLQAEWAGTTALVTTSAPRTLAA